MKRWFVMGSFVFVVLSACAPAAKGAKGEACADKSDCATPLVCIAKVCTEPDLACESGKERCDGDKLERCRVGSSGWDVVQTCAHGCRDAACREAICQPGDTKCEGGSVYRCSGDGSG